MGALSVGLAPDWCGKMLAVAFFRDTPFRLWKLSSNFSLSKILKMNYDWILSIAIYVSESIK